MVKKTIVGTIAFSGIGYISWCLKNPEYTMNAEIKLDFEPKIFVRYCSL